MIAESSGIGSRGRAAEVHMGVSPELSSGHDDELATGTVGVCTCFPRDHSL